ncbi:MAG: hypothetical protein HIU92_21195 [Proteobacteria bacterium]|nr:hypothetical protein [Pseudomonadota bacterium]
MPATPDPAVEVEPLLADLREAARRAGIQRDDPMMPLLTAFAQQIRFLATRNAQSEQVAHATSQKILNALTEARQTADSEIARFRKGIAATESDTIKQIAAGIAEAAKHALTRRVVILQWSRIGATALILVVLTVGSLAGGYWWGRSTALASIHETEAGLQVAFEAGAGAAQKWLDLMQWNRITDALSQCTGSALYVQLGRKACSVPLWIEPPQPSPPPLQ